MPRLPCVVKRKIPSNKMRRLGERSVERLLVRDGRCFNLAHQLCPLPQVVHQVNIAIVVRSVDKRQFDCRAAIPPPISKAPFVSVTETPNL